MRYIIAIVSATALAALSSVVCGYFVNDPAKGISTGFSQGELKVIPWIVFIITLVSLSKGKSSTKPTVSQDKSDSAEQIPEKSTRKNQKTHEIEVIAKQGGTPDVPESAPR
jgi:hypothetical protein